MASKTITSANSTFTLSVAGIFSSPQRIQGYSTDAAFAVAAVNIAETMMGVDGHLSAGFTPVAKVQTITLQADSKSNDIFDQWAQFMEANREVYLATGNIRAPSIQKKFTLSNGILTSHTFLPEARKVYQPRVYQITWESITPSAL